MRVCLCVRVRGALANRLRFIPERKFFVPIFFRAELLSYIGPFCHRSVAPAGRHIQLATGVKRLVSNRIVVSNTAEKARETRRLASRFFLDAADRRIKPVTCAHARLVARRRIRASIRAAT